MQNNDKENMDQIDNNEELIDDGVVDSTDTADEVTQLTTRVAELEDKNLRLFAEFENFRKRTQKEKYELIKTASQDILSALLPVLDDFDRTKKIAGEMAEQDGFVEGVLLVYKKLQTLLHLHHLQSCVFVLSIHPQEIHPTGDFADLKLLLVGVGLRNKIMLEHRASRGVHQTHTHLLPLGL